MSEKMVRVSFTLPPDIVEDLKFIARKMSVSRSSCLASLLRGPTEDLRTILDAVPDNPTPEDVLRARGVSNGVILQRLGTYMGAMDGQGDLLENDNH